MLKKLRLGRAFGKSCLFVKNSYMWSRPRLETFIKYAKVELTPPSREDLPAIKEECRSLFCRALRGRWRSVTIREAWLNALVTTEVVLWFFVGECIGKRHFVGYKV